MSLELEEVQRAGERIIDVEIARNAIRVEVVQETGQSTTSVMSQKAVTDELDGKQEKLVSGENVKTINGQSVLGVGNIVTPDTDDYRSISHKPKIDGVELNGELTATQLGLARDVDIPTKVSELENDSSFITSSYHDSSKQNVISDLDSIREGASLGETAVQPSALDSYRTSSEQDVIDSGKQDVIDDIEEIRTKSNSAVQPEELSEVATSGQYSDLLGLPTIPTKVSELTNDSGFAVLPSQSGKNGKALFTDGTTTYWGDAQGGGGEENVIEDVKVNGVSLQVVSKSVDVQVPTKTSDLSNDSGFVDTSYHDNTKVDKIEGKGLSSEDFTGAEKLKLAGLSNYDDTSVKSRLADIESKESVWDGKQDAISDISTIRSGASKGATALQPTDVSTVATSGNYNDLSNKPVIPTVPTNVSAFNNDAGYLTQHQSLSSYRTASAQDAIDDTKVDKVSGKGLSTEDYTSAEKTKLSGIEVGAEVNVKPDWEAESGSQAEILNKPTIPSEANDGVLTIQKNGTQIDTFSANQSTNKTINIVVPTELSDLGDDALHRLVTDALIASWNGKSEVSGTNDGTNWLTITINGNTYAIPSGGGGISNHDFTFSTLANNTTAFTFAASQRCYQRVTMTAGATLTFSIANKADNYVRVYNSSASDITLAVGTITFNGTAISASSVVVPDDTISVKAGKYVEIGIVVNEDGAEITVSHKSKSNA